MFKKKVAVSFLLVAVVVSAVLTLLSFRYINDQKVNTGTIADQNSNVPTEEEYALSRRTDFKYVRPVYLTEQVKESAYLMSLKSGVSDFIADMKKGGELFDASVFVKDLMSNEWISVNPEKAYEPGSLFKVITLTAFLHMAESNLSILEKEVTYDIAGTPPVQTFNSKSIEYGHKYKIRDLLYYMIVFSDNNATMLLHKYMEVERFRKVFSDLGLKSPGEDRAPYLLSVRDYSRFISVIYDGGYLSRSSSEYAMTLLCESDFKLGITRELPKDLVVAHKFGESGKPGNQQIHESAIVYLNGRPYLLTIMTRGKESKQLVDVVSHISKIVYDYMAARPV
jgi:beta-lactamase class A